MIFLHYVSGGCTFIEAIFEDNDLKTSKRLEGVGVEISNRNPLVFFNKEYSDIHPDIIGLVCLAIFYPFIGSDVTFPQPITPKLAESINRDIFLKHKKLNIRNVSQDLIPYLGEQGEVLAFGGGMDSSAIRALFPEAFVVHEASIKNGILVADDANELTASLESKGRGSLVETNSRFISNPGGWHVWIGSIVTALLEAGKRRAKYIYAGTILGSAFMSNGAKYFDRHASSKWHGPSGNYWQQLFWDIGLPLVQPLMGCSEILTMQASLKYLNKNEISYCTADNGKACGVCPKCFRRSCIENYVTGEQIDFSRFDNNAVNLILNKNLFILDTYTQHLFHLDGRPQVLLEIDWHFYLKTILSV
ncbi:DUF6395 domain-containing protein [Arsukibacterium sp.]|uniref:DUF6395 domain-containing protein n=1 Tax=Arsukibacterium sp. TaxID=1977258 RepID=UPI001BD37412|nr:DUF6395 domain-containing protein [Arsukibacterium sp.]